MDFNTQLTINAEFLFEFYDKQDWINNAQLRFTAAKEHIFISLTIICIDKNGNEAYGGSDFNAADEHNLFPIKAYAIKRTINSIEPKIAE